MRGTLTEGLTVPNGLDLSDLPAALEQLGVSGAANSQLVTIAKDYIGLRAGETAVLVATWVWLLLAARMAGQVLRALTTPKGWMLGGGTGGCTGRSRTTRSRARDRVTITWNWWAAPSRSRGRRAADIGARGVRPRRPLRLRAGPTGPCPGAGDVRGFVS